MGERAGAPSPDGGEDSSAGLVQGAGDLAPSVGELASEVVVGIETQAGLDSVEKLERAHADGIRVRTREPNSGTVAHLHCPDLELGPALVHTPLPRQVGRGHRKRLADTGEATTGR